MTAVLRRGRAVLMGYFWLPCPACGEMFGGFEIDYDSPHKNSIPDPGHTSTFWVRRGQCICKRCTARGVGCRAWAEAEFFEHPGCEYLP